MPKHNQNLGNLSIFLHLTTIALLIALIIMIYVNIVKPHESMQQVIQSLRTGFRRTLPFGGPYEQCEDMVCPNFDGKKECIHNKAEDIMKCCQSVCHAKCVNLPAPALEECLKACTPLF